MDGTRAEELVERYADAILRIGYTWLGDMDDAKDICQTVLIKLVEEGRRFPDLGQERAWVVRLSVNACKNWKKSAWFRRRAPLEEGLHLAAEVPEPEDGALLALEARRPAPRRQIPLRRVAALAACAGLVLGLVNYQAVAAGTERVIRYFLGVGAAEENLSLLVQGEALHKEDGAFLYRIGGAYQRDGMLTVPVSVFTREGALAEGEELRYRLLPYLYDLFAECEKTGLPIMRPLVLHYEKDENTWNLNDEFLVGEHLLVAPVLEQGQTKKMVYLPEGIWYDFNTGKRYEGKQYYLVDAPLDTCPMFAKAGSMIPAYEVVQYVGEKPYDTLNMLVFPGEGTYVHYQDNGSDFAYQDGAYNEYAFTQQENGEVTMKMGKEGYEKPYKKIEYIFVGK